MEEMVGENDRSSYYQSGPEEGVDGYRRDIHICCGRQLDNQFSSLLYIHQSE